MQANSIWIQFQFEGFHRWRDAPDVVAFLRDTHRHQFHVRVEWLVSHAEREREFFIEQRKAKDFVEQLRADPDSVEWSCETWASRIMHATGACRVDVSEDGENGATVCSR
jgi:hypothetical protein